MKFIICFICFLSTTTLAHSQDIEKNYATFFSIQLDTIVGLEFNLDFEKNLFKNEVLFSKPTRDDFNRIDFNVRAEELNKKMFSNLTFYENTYIDYSDYLRGCGPLDDGITNNVKSGDVMLSNIIDNFVNTYLLKNLIFKN
jgi:hypothetical protein